MTQMTRFVGSAEVGRGEPRRLLVRMAVREGCLLAGSGALYGGKQ